MRRSPLISKPIVGADIEVFLQDVNTKEIVSAEGIVKGTKKEPFQFKEGQPFFMTSLDNVMCEFGIPPAKDADEFVNNIDEAIGYIKSTLPAHLDVFAYPSARVDAKYLQTENALLFGCEPDFNAWEEGAVNDAPDAFTNVRSCGGHIHTGYQKPTDLTNMALIRAMDVFVGLPSILQEPENERKRLYGKAGAFRHKKYGTEYRTVSNYYLQSKELTRWAFLNTMEAIEFVNIGGVIGREEGNAIQAAINYNNHELAQTMCTYFGVKTLK